MIGADFRPFEGEDDDEYEEETGLSKALTSSGHFVKVTA